jgi:quinol monooxygenase YgiN
MSEVSGVGGAVSSAAAARRLLRWGRTTRTAAGRRVHAQREGTMIVVRFRVQCQPAKTEQVLAAFRDVVRASRTLKGVVSFDIGRDVADDDAFIATEVFEDREALDRQEALPEVAKALELLGDALVAEPEATIFHVSSSEAWG